MVYCVLENTPVGTLTAGSEAGAISYLAFGRKLPEGAKEESLPIFDKLKRELEDYFMGRIEDFSVPVRVIGGTPFERRCWNALRMIPFGETITYSSLALRAGSINGARAAGNACNHNPIAILIPCHRVVGANGSLTGYAGSIDIKRRLLALEGVAVK